MPNTLRINKMEIYGLGGILRLSINYIRTKLFHNKARIIRFPIEIRGKKYIDFGVNLTIGVGCRIEAFPAAPNKPVIVFGNNVQINDYVHITAMENVSIGNNVLMASKIYISDCSHGFYGGTPKDSSPNEIPINRQYYMAAVVIEDNVWIGESVSILPGVNLGKGCIIGANSVVTKNIPKYTIAVGNPARVIKKFNFELKIWERI